MMATMRRSTKTKAWGITMLVVSWAGSLLSGVHACVKVDAVHDAWVMATIWFGMIAIPGLVLLVRGVSCSDYERY